MRKRIAAALRAQRLARGLTLKAAADLLEISSVQLRKYELGEDRIAAERLAVLAKHWKFSVDELLKLPPMPARDDEDAAFEREIQGLFAKVRLLPPRARRDVRRLVDQLTAEQPARP